MPVAQTGNDQVIEASVSGPDGANRQYTCTGTAAYLVQSNGSPAAEVLTFLVGPPLERRQFHRAICTVSVSQQYFGFNTNVDQFSAQYSIDIPSVEADWDDETGRTEVRVEIRLNAYGLVAGATVPGNAYLHVNQVRYWVTILAELPA